MSGIYSHSFCFSINLMHYDMPYIVFYLDSELIYNYNKHTKHKN